MSTAQSSLSVFRNYFYAESTSAGLSTDSDWDDQPDQSIGPGLVAGVTGYGYNSPAVRRGILKRVYYQINPTNAVTYRLTILEARTGADQSYQTRMNIIFDSNEVTPGGAAGDTRYDATELDRPFTLESRGDFYYNLDWSGAPGDTTGFIYISGVYEEGI